MHSSGMVSSPHMDTNETKGISLPVAVVIAGFLIAGAVVWDGSKTAISPTGNVPTGGTAAVAANIKNVKISGSPFIGKANAPLTIAFWSDFQCPFCKNFVLGTLPQVVKDYVDTGKVKIVFMEFPFLGDDSTIAAAYSLSVWKLYPDKYSEWSNAIYTAQDEEGGQGFGDAESINELNATIPGIDAAKVSADVEANIDSYKTTMNSDKAEAQKVGINATPSFLIGTKIISGARPYEDFKAAIDAQLK